MLSRIAETVNMGVARCLVMALGILVTGGAGVAVAMTIDITNCGQSVPDHATGVLNTDLVCGDSASAVFVGERGKLAFAGHSITGGGVLCTGSCTLRGPGTVQDVMPATPFGGASGIFAGGTGIDTKLVVRDLVVNGNHLGIMSNAEKTTLVNVTASNNLGHGVWAMFDVSAKNVTTNDNAQNGFRSEQGKCKVIHLTSTGNGQMGLVSNGTGTNVLNSTLTGNSFGPFEGYPTALDLYSFEPPKVKRTICEHSLGPDQNVWGVCSGD